MIRMPPPPVARTLLRRSQTQAAFAVPKKPISTEAIAAPAEKEEKNTLLLYVGALTGLAVGGQVLIAKDKAEESA
ncbi:hypothetical protein T439DRAFT_376641 [Meredithblackwellia eburnea MCA 4105]